MVLPECKSRDDFSLIPFLVLSNVPYAFLKQLPPLCISKSL